MPLDLDSCPNKYERFNASTVWSLSLHNRGQHVSHPMCRIWDQELVLLAAASSVTLVTVCKTSHRPPSAIFVSHTSYNNYTFQDEPCYTLHDFRHSQPSEQRVLFLGFDAVQSGIYIDGHCGLLLRVQDRRSTFLRNVSRFVQNCMASQPKIP